MGRANIVLVLVACLCAPASGGAVPASSPLYQVAVRDLIPLADWQKRFKITDGKDQGKVVPLTLHRGPGTQEGWRLDFGDYAGLHLKSDPNGTLVMERLDLFKSRSFILYEPALPIFARDVVSGVA